MIELLTDPAAWLGLLTLIVLELVLGIDNLVFIAILAEKLPPHQRDRARIVGLSLAMLMRLGLLVVISWLVALTEPLFSLGPLAPSGRDLILFLGGLFLLYKGTTELHERLEGTASAGFANALPNRCFAFSAASVKSRPRSTRTRRNDPWKHRRSPSKNATWSVAC